MQITSPQIHAAFPVTPIATIDAFVVFLNDQFAKHDINTVNRAAAFLAQCGVESGGFLHLVENLNYSAEGLRRVWPSHFSPALAEACAHNPEKIANIAYANRYENGDAASGDGFKFRGRGLIQVTFKANYAAFKAATGHDVIAQPEWLATPQGAVESAVWFWTAHSLNAFADKGDMLSITKRVNGGTTALSERCAAYGKIRIALK